MEVNKEYIGKITFFQRKEEWEDSEGRSYYNYFIGLEEFEDKVFIATFLKDKWQPQVDSYVGCVIQETGWTFPQHRLKTPKMITYNEY